jgi:F0F1-type ATP synthase membrane subunit b/b'
VAPRKSSESKQDPNLTAAAEKASMVIRGLQARLQQRLPEQEQETADDLERQLAHYFEHSVPTSRQPLLDDLRGRVIDGVADRILRQWEQHSSIESAVVERLIDRLVERLCHGLS